MSESEQKQSFESQLSRAHSVIRDPVYTPWNSKETKLLCNWGNVCRQYSSDHNRARRFYSTIDNIIKFLSMVIATTVTAAAALSTNDDRTTEIVLGALLIFINAISSYWNFAGNAESHKSTSAGFSKIARNIQIEVVRDVEMRQAFTTFIEKISIEYEYIMEDAPPVFTCCKVSDQTKDVHQISSTIDAFGIGKSIHTNDNSQRADIVKSQLIRLDSVVSLRSDDSLIAQIGETMREHSDRSDSEKSKHSDRIDSEKSKHSDRSDSEKSKHSDQVAIQID